MKKRVFLGGTCNETTWRDELISKIDISYFNPVVLDWNKDAQANEEREKEICQFHLYVLTPKMTGFFSIAELIDDSNKIKDRTLFCFFESDGHSKFDEFQMKSIKSISKMALKNGAIEFKNLDEIATYLNKLK